MTTNPALTDEHQALTSIYDTSILTITSSSNTSTTAILSLPAVPYDFTIVFPSTYPDTPPSITGTHHVSSHVKIGTGERVVTLLRDLLHKHYHQGQVVLFDLIEEASELLRDDGADTESTAIESEESVTKPAGDEGLTSSGVDISKWAAPEWTVSEALVVNKSSFVARCVAIKDLEGATGAISHLLATNKRCRAATHNISAWRVKQRKSEGVEVVVQDSDDDGETAAGGRLLHLMQLMDVWNVVVVVSRWYGGVKLGPDRFRCINSVAREALVGGGFVKDEKEKGGGKKVKK